MSIPPLLEAWVYRLGPSATDSFSRGIRQKVRQLKIPLDLMPVQIKDHTIHPAVQQCYNLQN